MKKKIISIVLAIWILMIVISVVLLFLPRTIHLDGVAVKYRLGEDNREPEQKVHINMDGKRYLTTSGDYIFRGTIDIEGESFPVPEDQKGLEIRFHKGYGLMEYIIDENEKTDIFVYGTLFVDRAFTKLTIAISEEDSSGEQRSRSWSSEDGLMLSMPATNRSEAIQLSNELMETYLGGYTLK
ncbi:hypothetical protein HW560_13130 [Paenibacillus sp. E222]|uniref:hypothetical protein n=1 Tax=Paenibacillus sp. E222 TaxID=2748863 RepID=UPI0015C670E4|nr:hypothetical protein [Paenibacillus sp. E222]QLG38947.1 hypothetical protein HW560_13130 [Paenibacillus sp. E222]